MRTSIQTRTTTDQFDGSAGQGLVDFADLPIPAGESVVPIVTAIALENNGAEDIPTIDCFFKPAAASLSTTERITVRRLTPTSANGSQGFSLAGCRIPVPKASDGTPWVLVLVTTGKTLGASLVVSYESGRALAS